MILDDHDSLIPVGAQVGDVLAGKYRIDGILGAGGMGVVVAAHHVDLDEKVAIKLLLPDTADRPENVARFIREARASVKIKSEHVARVMDIGNLDSGAPYIVMEHLSGEDLASWLSQRGPLPIAQAVDFVLQTCEAIAHAHVLGIVHRDLKPANLFCIRRADGTRSIKVLDFGISKLIHGPDSCAELDLTKTAAVFGSPVYMSPEQLQSARDVDERTDIWSLGIILYELVSATPPFHGDNYADLCIKIATQPHPSLRDLRPEVPVALESVVDRCLAKVRADRFSAVGALAAALAPFGGKTAVSYAEKISAIIQHPATSAYPSTILTEDRSAIATARSNSSLEETAVQKAPPRHWRWLVVAAMAIVTVAIVARQASKPSGTATPVESASARVTATGPASTAPMPVGTAATSATAQGSTVESMATVTPKSANTTATVSKKPSTRANLLSKPNAATTSHTSAPRSVYDDRR